MCAIKIALIPYLCATFMKHTLLLLLLLSFTSSAFSQQNPPKEKAVQKKSTTRKKETSKTKKLSKSDRALKNKGKSKEESKVKAIVKQPSVMYSPIRKNGKMLTGSIYSVSGFRICIYSGANREQAIQIKQNYIKTNSTFKNYISYNRPYYRIKVGDFENKKMAARELKKIVVDYPNAFIVPDIVTVKKFVVSK